MLNKIYKHRLELTLFVLIIAMGVGSRIWLADFPNFKPVAALALFAGFFFRRPWVAVAAIGSMMLISDMKLGFYECQLALAVYGSMGVSIALGLLIKQRLPQIGAGQLGGFVAASLVMSTVFFVVTNFAVWAMGMWYPPTTGGLASCFTAALPFYRWTLCGDLIFTVGIAGAYQMCVMLAAQRESELQSRLRVR